MKLLVALDTMKKSQLQQYSEYWCNGNNKGASRDELVKLLRSRMTDVSNIYERYDALRDAEKGFLQGILLMKNHSGSVVDIRRKPPARHIEDFQIEDVVKRLKEQGFLLKSVQKKGNNNAIALTVPTEIAEILKATIELESRTAEDFLSLQKAVARKSENNKRLSSLVKPEAVKKRVAAIKDEELASVFWKAASDAGGILLSTEWRRSGGKGALNRPQWRRQLEEKHLGTTGRVTLKSYGIELEEEALCVYQEIVHALADAESKDAAWENSRELSVGADLVIDLSKLLQILYIEPLELTKKGHVYKKTKERLHDQFVLSFYQSFFEESFFDQLVRLAEKIDLVEQKDNALRIKEKKVQYWEEKSVIERVKIIYLLFLKEHGRRHYSFHQKYLRDLFVEEIRKLEEGKWVSIHSCVQKAISRFLLSLNEHHIDLVYKGKANHDSHDEVILVSLERLRRDLYFWIIHRLALCGLVDLGYKDGHLQALSISSLGAVVLAGQSENREEERHLLVNPDFEVLLMPGKKRYAESSIYLSHFAERVGSERVKRYKLTRRSIKRAVLSGLAIDDIISFLSMYSKEEVPDNVSYTIREWSEGVELIHRRQAVLLKSQTEDGMNRLVEVLEEHNVTHERVTPTVLFLTGSNAEKNFLKYKERLREEGLYID